jgi:tripartite-type tricarboxylate transporter receptor subunit TctC
MRKVITIAVASAALAAAASTPAQTYPSRPVTIVVGFAPGGGTDITARLTAKKLNEYLGQNVVVENRAGAGGSIAAGMVSKANPDGYTILLGTIAALAIAPHLNSKLPYDSLRDLAPISGAVTSANVLVVHPSVQAKTLAEYVKEANANPKGMTYGSSGIGSAGNLSGELFRIMAKANLTHVPYKGGGPAMNDLIAGQIPSVFASASTAVGQVKSGRIRALATTGPKRSTSLPDVPTIAESGYPGYEATNWYAYVAPAKTPTEIIARLNREIVRTLRDPETREHLLRNGEEPMPTTPEELGRHIEREHATWGKVIKEAGIPMEQ